MCDSLDFYDGALVGLSLFGDFSTRLDSISRSACKDLSIEDYANFLQHRACVITAHSFLQSAFEVEKNG